MNLETTSLFKNLQLEGSIIIEGETLKKCQDVILRIAEDIIGLFEEEGIWYQLGGGTALGAVRHKGFIPWDDDIDINILGKDKKRIKELICSRFSDKYTYVDYTTKDYGLPMSRVVLKNSIYRDRQSIGSENCGFFIDIFPIENVPNNILLRKIHGTLCIASVGLLSCRKFFRDRKFLMDIASQNQKIKRIFTTKIRIGFFVGWIPLSIMGRITNSIFGMCKNEKSKNVTIPSGRKHYFKRITAREQTTINTKADFEGHRWNVVADYDNYFKTLYGNDYMIPPQEDKREHHMVLELVFPKE